MSGLITLDFETFYDRDFSLSKMTTEEYVRHPDFEVIGVSVKLDGYPTDWFSGSMDETRDWLHAIQWDDKLVLAHNTMFDGAILGWHFSIKPRLWLDTLSMARPKHGTTVGGSLKALALHYDIGAKGTEVINALGKRRADFSEDELAQYGQYCINDTNLTHKLFKLLSEGFPKHELLLIDQTIRMFTEPLLTLDGELLTNHLEAVKAGKKEALRDVLRATFKNNPTAAKLIVEGKNAGKSIKELLMSNDLFAALLQSTGVEPPTKVSVKTGKTAWAFAKTDEGLTSLLEHDDMTVQALVAARLETKSTIEETRTQRFIELAGRGPMPIPLNYSGAFQTWRWSGADKLNLQNLPRGGVLRKAMQAPEGYAIVAVDSSNIELRVNHTLAGQMDSIDAFRNGQDLYCEFATILFGRQITKADKHERQLGKLAHLSLGYGCGWEKFQHICRMNGVPLEDEQAQHIVKLWRATYPAIPAFWKDADKALPAIAAGAHLEIGHSGLFYTSELGIHTPPSHVIRYAELSRDEDGWTYANRRQRKKIYGAAIVENLCQHVARNIIAHQWLEADKWVRRNAPGWRIILQVHDELVMCGPAETAEAVNAAVIEIMSQSPEWWPEVPLAAEGGIGPTYGSAH